MDQTKLRPTKEMLKDLSREDVEELTELFGALVGRFLKSSSAFVEEVEASNQNLDVEIDFPAYMDFKEDVEQVSKILDEEGIK